MLSISEFSEVCHLSPQTLRFYHSEGLLVPADVNEQTGYRSYTFGQVEQAMLVAVLRRAGLSVKLVRRALDEPDTAPVLLEQHSAEVQRLRRAQDEALRDARELLSSWPEAHQGHAPEMTVVSRPVPGPSAARVDFDWYDADAAAIAATVRDLIATVESRGVSVSGVPWWTWANETPEQKRHVLTAAGPPHWLAKVPVTASEEALAALCGDVEVQRFEARDELSVFLPGRSSMAKFGTALSCLLTHRLDNAFVDVSRMRHLLHDDGVETTAAICRMDETDGA